MPAGYLIAEIDVKDAALFERYRAGVPAVIAKFGGTYAARGGRNEKLAGRDRLPRITVVKFPTYERALEFYRSADYAPLLKMRLDATESHDLVVEGLE